MSVVVQFTVVLLGAGPDLNKIYILLLLLLSLLKFYL